MRSGPVGSPPTYSQQQQHNIQVIYIYNLLLSLTKQWLITEHHLTQYQTMVTHSGHHQTLCLPKKLISKRAPLESEHEIYRPTRELTVLVSVHCVSVIWGSSSNALFIMQTVKLTWLQFLLCFPKYSGCGNCLFYCSYWQRVWEIYEARCPCTRPDHGRYDNFRNEEYAEGCLVTGW